MYKIIYDISYHFTKFKFETQLVHGEIKRHILLRDRMDHLKYSDGVNSNTKHKIILWLFGHFFCGGTNLEFFQIYMIAIKNNSIKNALSLHNYYMYNSFFCVEEEKWKHVEQDRISHIRQGFKVEEEH